jgi:hypothetical protein
VTTPSTFAADAFEPIYSWFEQRADVAVEVWGLENNRAVALLAYCDGPGDEFGWSNWTRAANEDPSVICGLFERLQLIAEDTVTAQLNAAFPGVLTAGVAGPS